MVKGVIFDMDGLMFDTERMWGTFWKPILNRRGYEVAEGLPEACRGSAGEQLNRILRGYYPGCDAEGIVADLKRMGEEVFAAGVPKMPGLDRILAYLAQQGIPMAVASSSSEMTIRNNLRNAGVEHYFAVAFSGSSVQRSKPAPDIFLAAAEKLGVAPAECLVLEDSFNGVRAGAAGGFITVMVPDTMQPDAEISALYTRCCGSLNEVCDLLEAGEL